MLDVARGVAIVAMVVYHFCFDLAWNGWLVLQALILALHGGDPADFQAGPLAALTCAMTVSAAALLGRAVFGSRRNVAVCATLLFVPLVTLLVGGQSLAGELEDGSLATLLSQPVTRISGRAP